MEHLRWLLRPSTTTFRIYNCEYLEVILFTLTHPSKRRNTCFTADNMLQHKKTSEKY